MKKLQFRPVSHPGQRSLLLTSLVSGALLLVSGCAEPVAEFSVNSGADDLLPPAKTALVKAVDERFGSPQHLVAWDRLPVNFSEARGAVAAVNGQTVQVTWEQPPAAAWHDGEVFYTSGKLVEKTAKAKLSGESLEVSGDVPQVGDKLVLGFGKQLQFGRAVYMKNCQHCHGVAGDGNGPTAQYLNPRPRDYRKGILKFTSTKNPNRATRKDIERIIQNGIPGTYMPSFLLLGEKETLAVVEYVRWLAIRGEVEDRMITELRDFNQINLKKQADEKNPYGKVRDKALDDLKKLIADKTEDGFDGLVEGAAEFSANAWNDAEGGLVVPEKPRLPDTAESRARGRALFLSDKTKCYTCHGPNGRGDGDSTRDYWPRAVVGPGQTEKYPEPGLHDIWGNVTPPRDLTKGQYRGGRRPVDLYYRLRGGIKGTQMPPFGSLAEEEVWDLVNYVMHIPFDAKGGSGGGKAHMAALPNGAELAKSGGKQNEMDE